MRGWWHCTYILTNRLQTVDAELEILCDAQLLYTALFPSLMQDFGESFEQYYDNRYFYENITLYNHIGLYNYYTLTSQ